MEKAHMDQVLQGYGKSLQADKLVLQNVQLYRWHFRDLRDVLQEKMVAISSAFSKFENRAWACVRDKEWFFKQVCVQPEID